MENSYQLMAGYTNRVKELINKPEFSFSALKELTREEFECLAEYGKRRGLPECEKNRILFQFNGADPDFLGDNAEPIKENALSQALLDHFIRKVMPSVESLSEQSGIPERLVREHFESFERLPNSLQFQ
jgi:hypothetical protein